ncbi:MAG: FHA domain-containing protein [Planctomycetota bacterium]|nr:FHA domain-containing protein [Planctomycetota bacterium]MEC8862871.1 FHA domain-containing protein [Planctomycetota bacterium]
MTVEFGSPPTLDVFARNWYFDLLERGLGTMYGELVPVGGGDPIPLLEQRLRLGRREGCDIVLRYANISSHHGLLEIDEGYWFIKDLNSSNGIKVNGRRIMPGTRKRLDPGDKVTFAKHEFEMAYEPHKLGAVGTPPQDEQLDQVFGQTLLQRAGLDKNRKRS